MCDIIGLGQLIAYVVFDDRPMQPELVPLVIVDRYPVLPIRELLDEKSQRHLPSNPRFQFRAKLESVKRHRRMPACSSVAQHSASTTLLNSTRKPSPVVLTSRPLCAAIVGSNSSACIALKAWRVPLSSAPIRRE